MDLSAVRTWAREQGFDVGTRGRIKPEILTAYAVAHGLETEPAPSSPPAQTRPDEKVLVARPLASPGVAESYGEDAAAVAKVYVPGADHDDLTDALVAKARNAKAAIVRVGPKLKLHRDSEPPQGSMLLLDWREKK